MTTPSVTFVRSAYGDGYMSEIKTRGLVRLDEDFLVFEFRSTTTRYDTFSSKRGDVSTVSIPLDEIEALEAKGGAWWPRLLLRTRSVRALEHLPDADGNEWTVRVPWRERTRARELAVSVSLQLANRELRRLEGGEA